MAKENKNKRKLSPAEKGLNAILVLVIVLVLALAGYATGPKVWSGLKAALPQGPQPDTSIVSGMAESLDMTVDEFKAEYELPDDVTGDFAMSEVISQMTLKNYAKLNEKEYSQMVDEFGIADKVTEDTLWEDAEVIIPVGKYLGEETFNQIKEYYKLDDSITQETLWGDVMPVLEQKQAEINASAQPLAE